MKPIDGDVLLNLYEVMPPREKIDDLDFFFDEEMYDENGDLLCRVFVAFIVYHYAYVEPFIVELSNSGFKANCVFESSAFVERMTPRENAAFMAELEAQARKYLHLT